MILKPRNRKIEESAMNRKKISVNVGNFDDVAKEVIDIWHKAEAGKAIADAPIEKIYFEKESLLFKTLTRKRCDLLKYVHESGAISIRQLAKELNRDYSNIHQDVKALYSVGLMLKNEKTKKYYVPWESIVTEIFLTKEATDKPNVHRHAHYHTAVAHGLHG